MMTTPSPSGMNIMVDIETIGTSLDAMILAIGAVRFNPFSKDRAISTTEGSFRWVADLRCPQAGANYDLQTIAWWMVKTEEEARQRMFSPTVANRSVFAGHIKHGLEEFQKWIAASPTAIVWAYGPEFDITVLNRAFENNMMAKQFERSNVRDYRTLRFVGNILRIPEPIFVGVEHDPLDDAFHYAGHAITILRKLAGCDPMEN